MWQNQAFAELRRMGLLKKDPLTRRVVMDVVTAYDSLIQLCDLCTCSEVIFASE
jgi:hypothetical protein